MARRHIDVHNYNTELCRKRARNHIGGDTSEAVEGGGGEEEEEEEEETKTAG